MWLLECAYMPSMAAEMCLFAHCSCWNVFLTTIAVGMASFAHWNVCTGWFCVIDLPTGMHVPVGFV